MGIKGRILKVSRKGRFEYEYSVLAPDGRRYTMDVDSRLHELIVKRDGDPVGRFIEYDMEKDIFRFLD